MNQDKTRFLDDEYFYTLARFRDLMLGTKVFKLSDISIRSTGDDMFNRIHNEYEEWIGSLVVRIDKGFRFAEVFERGLAASKKDRHRQGAVYEKLFEKLKTKNHLSIDEVASISWPMIEIYEFIRFDPSEYRLNKSQIDDLNKKVSDYLYLFENDSLKINRNNYYRFEIQKKLFIERIEKNEMVKHYGNNFVISEIIDYLGKSKQDCHFLFVQTAYALSDMGCLKVFDAWSTDEVLEDRKVYINIEIYDLLLNSLNQEYQKQNPSIKLEGYNKKTGIVNFAGKDIFLTKKSKTTDAMRLMDTLLNIDEDEWAERGEVFLDWGMTDDDREHVAKNKIYFAKQAINDAVARQTGIENFIEGGTFKWRINPRYRNKS